MRTSSRMTRAARGFTLIEVMVALLVGTVVLGAAYRLLTGNQRFYRAQSQIVDVQQNLRAVVALLPAELREISASGGDIQSMTATAIDVRVMRGFGIICATPNVGSAQIVLRNDLLTLYRALDASRSGALIFRDRKTDRASDDQWLTASITATAAQNCTDGTAGTRLTLSVTGGASLLDSVTVGSPVRIFERVQYSLYQSGGSYWLGVQTMEGGSWTAISAVAGPLDGANGLQFTYRDSTGAVTATAANVASIDVFARGVTAQTLMRPGRPAGVYRDSLSIRTAIRND